MKKNLASWMDAIVYPAASFLLVLALWSGLAASGWLAGGVLPGPGAVWEAAIEETSSGRMANHLLSSGYRLAIGYSLGAAVGVIAGLVLGLFSPVRAALLPAVEMLRPIPPLAWIPLALIWFGIDEASKLFLIALTSAMPLLIATMKGVQQVDPALLRAARSMDVAPLRMLFSVVFPAAMPDIMTGLRLGWTLAITILVGAEMIAAPSGLGFLIMDGMNSGKFEFVILGILTLGALSVLTDGLFALASRSKLLRWHAGLDKATA